MLCHGVVFDPCVSMAEELSKSLSLCSISSTASLFRGSPIPLRRRTRRFISHMRHCVVPWFVRHWSHVTFLLVCADDSFLSLARGRVHVCELCCQQSFSFKFAAVLRNLHDYLQFGCSEHLRSFGSSQPLFFYWDFNYPSSELPKFSMSLVSLAP